MKSALIKITYSCNNNCLFCYEYKNEKFLSLKDFILLLDELNMKGISNIIFSGGEPTLHPELNKMVDLLIKKSFSFEIVTNGRLLSDSKFGYLLDKSRKIHITILSTDKDVHNFLANSGDSYSELMKSLETIPDKDKVIINFILTSKTQNRINEEVFFLDKKGFKNLKLTLLFKGSMSEKLFNDLKPNLRLLFDSINSLVKQFPFISVEGLPICFFNLENNRDVLISNLIISKFCLETETLKRRSNVDERIRPSQCKGACSKYAFCNGIYAEYYSELSDLLNNP